MTPEELQRELDGLWAKVGSSSSAELPRVPIDASAMDDLKQDAFTLLKRQQRQKEASWADLLEAKDRALEAARARLEALEGENLRLSRRLEREEGIVVGEVLSAREKLSAGVKSLEAERAQFEEERRRLEAILEATRQRLAAESFRAMRLQEDADRREAQYLLDLKELQVRAERHSEGRADAQAEAGKLSGSLKEAKNALEKTLAELLRERQLREETEKERAQALKKISDLEDHFKSLSNIWEEERSQWRELWERERSTWEGQRKEIESWETSLRKERESWQAEIQGQESKHVAFVSQINASLRESSETSAKLASMVGVLDRIGALDLPGRRADLGRRARKGLVLALAGALVLSLFPLWRHFSRPRLKVVSAEPVVLDNPTGMSFDGAKLWFSQWDGDLVSFDPKDLKTRSGLASVKGVGAYHPTALASGPDSMWSVDSAQARIVKHRPGRPEEVLGAMASPGAAPAALAFDGSSLWLYDAATQSLYRQKGGAESFEPVPAEAELVPSALAFVDGRLWVFDSRSKELVILSLKDGKLRVWSRQPLSESVAAVSVAGKEVWALVGPAMDRPGHSLVRYRY
ncbi:MAG: hypothetical protein HY924_04970 [Elusimicrobia bacterium]|nr:hypothetical protein [Elusimicrobiota bacterium]